MHLNITCKKQPVLDPGFVPAVLWTRKFKQLALENGGKKLLIALERTDGTVSVYESIMLPKTPEFYDLNKKHIERLVKFLLWQKGGYKIYLSSKHATYILEQEYSEKGTRKFDYEFMGDKVYGKPMEFIYCEEANFPKEKETAISLGRHLDGCRIGFDIGGSDRKCAAVVDGKVVYSEEIKWSPYFETDPSYHIEGINNSLKNAASHMPRVDAIGGSAAGVYVNNEVRVAGIFRGLSKNDFESHIRKMFFNLKERWNNIPFEVVNDGEVTALAGSMSMKENAVLGISMGTSTAAGYVTENGNITTWLNELAFAPIDYRDHGPIDEWSGHIGCAVQFFSQQGVARLAALAGINFAKEIAFPERLEEVQRLMKENDPRARKIYETIGACFGYAIAQYADFYNFRNILILGRVTSGEGGEIIIKSAEEVLELEFPEIAKNVTIKTPDENDKRHGQAIAAASLPPL